MRIATGILLSSLCFTVFGCNGNSTPSTDSGSGSTSSTGTAASTGASSTGTSTASTTASTAPLTDLKIDDIKVGTGRAAQAGDRLTMEYTGSLKNGTVFDSTDSHGGKPFSFQLGAGSVIKGWDQGLVGIKEGGERKLSIPYALGYGDRGQGDKIPPRSDLYFDVKLKHLQAKGDIGQVTSNDKKMGTGAGVKEKDIVSILWTVTDEDGEVVYDMNAKKPTTFVVGDHTQKPVVEQGIVGMKLNGERILSVPGEYLNMGPAVHPGGTYTIDINLVKLTPGH